MVVGDYDLYCKFDAEKHREKYLHYLEVVIDEDGEIFYANPSHQKKMIRMAVEKLGISEDELWERCPPEYYFDVLTWLWRETGAIPVWTEFYRGEPNDKQRDTLAYLKDMGIYEGDI